MVSLYEICCLICLIVRVEKNFYFLIFFDFGMDVVWFDLIKVCVLVNILSVVLFIISIVYRWFIICFIKFLNLLR